MKKKSTLTYAPQPLESDKALKVWLVNQNISSLLGEILTIVDASTDGEKNKAIKDLVKERFGNKQDWFIEMVYHRDIPDVSDKTKLREDWMDGVVKVVERGEGEN